MLIGPHHLEELVVPESAPKHVADERLAGVSKPRLAFTGCGQRSATGSGTHDSVIELCQASLLPLLELLQKTFAPGRDSSDTLRAHPPEKDR